MGNLLKCYTEVLHEATCLVVFIDVRWVAIELNEDGNLLALPSPCHYVFTSQTMTVCTDLDLLSGKVTVK
jgi:hypothetical protein